MVSCPAVHISAHQASDASKNINLLACCISIAQLYVRIVNAKDEGLINIYTAPFVLPDVQVPEITGVAIAKTRCPGLIFFAEREPFFYRI